MYLVWPGVALQAAWEEMYPAAGFRTALQAAWEEMYPAAGLHAVRLRTAWLRAGAVAAVVCQTLSAGALETRLLPRP